MNLMLLCRPGEFTEIFPSDVVLLEGILVFYNKEVRDLFDMKLFVDTDADTRLARRGEKEYLMQVICSWLVQNLIMH